jgi:sortase A
MRNPARPKKRSTLRWAEYLFLLAGLIAVDYAIWINVNSQVYQVYDEWKFERTLRGDSTSLGTFIVDDSGLRRVIGLGTAPERMPEAKNPVAEREKQPGEPSPHRHNRDEVLGRLEIPRLNLRAIVREGADEGTLRHAVGHIPATAWPGEIGNVALAAHRDTFFRPLRNIRKNDRIIVSTLEGTYEYVVESTMIVAPSDVSVLKASTPKELTLVTCYPFYYVGSAPRRFIVHATQVAATPQPPPQQIGS